MKSIEFELFGWPTPNGQKIIIALEEAGADYCWRPVDISQGEQHAMAFRALSPDGKIPALIHHRKEPVTLFESGAILLYLADVFPVLHGVTAAHATAAQKAQVMSWTFWQVGQLGPMAGQFGQFQRVSTPNPEAVKQFDDLVWRCLAVLEKQLTAHEYLAGESFSVADIASFTWVASPQSYLQRYDFQWRASCPALVRWADSIAGRASVIKAFERR